MVTRFFPLLILVSFLAWGAQPTQACEKHAAAKRAGQEPGESAHGTESIYQLGSSWTNQEGAKVALDSFKGKPVVVAMVFTQCAASCPVITADLKRIEAQLPDPLKKETRFVLVSFDHENETPAQLKEFAKRRGLDPANWALLTGGGDQVSELAAVLGVKYRKDAKAGYLHSNVISVIDREGVIRHQQNGLRQDPGPTISVLKGLSR